MNPVFPLQDRIETLLLQMVIAGFAFSLLLPALHRVGAFGWPPLWLVGLPLAGWLGLRLVRWRDRALAAIDRPAVARPRRRPAGAGVAGRRHLPARGAGVRRRHRQSA